MSDIVDIGNTKDTGPGSKLKTGGRRKYNTKSSPSKIPSSGPRQLWKKMVKEMEKGHKKVNRGVGYGSSIPKPKKY